MRKLASAESFKNSIVKTSKYMHEDLTHPSLLQLDLNRCHTPVHPALLGLDKRVKFYGPEFSLQLKVLFMKKNPMSQTL